MKDLTEEQWKVLEYLQILFRKKLIPNENKDNMAITLQFLKDVKAVGDYSKANN